MAKQCFLCKWECLGECTWSTTGVCNYIYEGTEEERQKIREKEDKELSKLIKPCPFCGGKMKFYREAHMNSNQKLVRSQYFMHDIDVPKCVLDEICMPFTIGAGDAVPYKGYIGEYAEKWNRREICQENIENIQAILIQNSLETGKN